MIDRDDSRLRDVLRGAFLEDMGLGHEPKPGGVDPQAPGKVGGYALVELIGEGGSGRVWRALHLELLKPVALKILRTHPGLPESRIERFRREATTAAGLRHPNIIGVHDVGTDGDSCYMAMDLIEGGTLTEWIARESPTTAQLLRIVECVARAVHHAHGQGVLHRDLKPQNILIRPPDEPVIVDFGLARSEGDPSLTQDGAVLGTPNYMAPEQLRGEVSDLDARTDVYALGVLLYQAMTGRVPFAGESSAELHTRILQRRFDPPSAVRTDLPGALDVITARCLEPDADLRYESAEALADDLGRLGRGEPLVATPVTNVTRLLRRLQRRKFATALVTTLLLALCVSVWAATRQRSELDLVGYAHAIQASSGDLERSLDLVLTRAEEARSDHTYGAEGVEGRSAQIRAELERVIAAADDETGVGEAYRAWTLFLLDDPRALEVLEAAAIDHPENPFVPLTAARTALLAYAERAEWPSAAGVILHGGSDTFSSLAPNETPEMVALLAEAREELTRARSLAVWEHLLRMEWIVNLCEGFDAYASGDLERAVAELDGLEGRRHLFEASLILAMAHCRLGDLESAFEVAGQLQQRQPGLPQATQLLASLHRNRGHADIADAGSALSEFQAAHDLSSQLPAGAGRTKALAELSAAMAFVRMSLSEDPESDLREALAGFDLLCAQEPESYRTLSNRSSARVALARHLGGGEEADELMAGGLSDIDRALVLSDHHVVVVTARVQAYLARLRYHQLQGEVTEAEYDDVFAVLEDAEGLESAAEEMLYTRASLQFIRADERRKRREDAADLFLMAAEIAERAVERRPAFLEARQLACTARVYRSMQLVLAPAEILDVVREARDLRGLGLPNAITALQEARWLEDLMDQPGRDQGAEQIALALIAAWEMAAEEATTAGGRSSAVLSGARGYLALARAGGHDALGPEDCLTHAGALASKAIDEQGDDPTALILRAEVNLERGDLSGLRADAAKAASMPGSDAALRPLVNRLNNDAWRVVSESGAEPDAYTAALKRVQIAVELEPDAGHLLNTLGVALLRAGRFDDALRTLEASRRANAGSFPGGHPADLAFLVLAYHALERHDEARETFALLERLMQEPDFQQDPECRAFHAEARAGLGAKPK